MINYLEPSVVIVDDILAEINGIYDYYSQRGIGCKIFNPDLYEGDDYPIVPFSDVNIIYLDLYYSQVFDPERCVSWIRHIVKSKSFYVLIMWTKDGSKASEVSTLLQTHNISPFLEIVKSKSEYQNGEGFDFTRLFKQIDSDLNSAPALEEILIWKRTVKYSFNEIIGHLTKNPTKILDKLRKIIISHGGTSIKDSEDTNQKRNILFDALDTVLISNTKKNINANINELNSKTLYNLNAVVDAESDRELNSWFHFRMESDISPNLICPGLIAKNNHRFFKKLYSIQDDPKLERIFTAQRDNDVVIDDIVLVISRPCDIAQKKYGKNIKLLSGIIIYKAYRHPSGRKKNKIHLGESILPDSLQKYEHLSLNEEMNDITILFDFRYIFSVPEKIFIEKFENLKIFNKELLSEVQVQYSSYSSRLGVTQII